MHLGMRRNLWLFAALASAFFGAAYGTANADELLQLAPHSRIVLIGNTLAERMQYDGQWETLLHSRFPEHQLVVRNLGWSADELGLRPRSLDFQAHGHRLEDHQPDVILAFFGFNESFQGPAGLEQFRERLQAELKRLTTTSFNGQHPPQVVLVSPIPHENLGQRELPNGSRENARIEPYVTAMSEEAKAAKVRFVDPFHALQSRFAEKDQLTINGIHLNELGHQVVGEVLDRALFGPRPGQVKAELATLRREVKEKDLQFFYDHRAVNGFYIYGGRKEPFGVRNFPEEFKKLRQMIANRDRRIWEVAAGRSVPEVIDDSNTIELSATETNVPQDVKILTPEEQIATFQVPEGFVVELFASEREFPELMNPVSFTFDARGRMWVTTMPTYPMYLPGVPVDDRVLIIEDSDGDGRADTSKTFARGLHLPLGIELGDHGVYVSQQPNIMFLRDADGDDQADERSLVMHGFDSADSHHSISVFTWGPGGEMYFQEGTFHRSQVETPYGPVRLADAGVFRWEPRTWKLDAFVSYPFANPWGHCFDRWGQNFIADASSGNNYFAAAFSGQVDYPRKHRQMRTFHQMQWRPTCGCELVSSRQFPDDWQGDFLLNNDIGFQGVLRYRVRDDGSGFAGDPLEPLLRSTDVAHRPVDLKFGPDGCLYVCDWYNPLVGHMQHSLRDPKRDKLHGRIWRIRYTGKPTLERPAIAGRPIPELLDLLKSYEDRTRYAVRRELRDRPSNEVTAAINTWLAGLKKDDPDYEHHRLEALWVLQHHDIVAPELLTSLLGSPEPRARAAAVRVLCYQRDRVLNTQSLLAERAGDEHPRVRLEVLRAASFFDRHTGGPIALAVLSQPLDYYLEYCFEETADTLDRRRPGDEPTMASGLAEKLASGRVPTPQVTPLVRLLCRRGDPNDLGRVFDMVVANSAMADDLRQAALEALAAAAEERKIIPQVAGDRLVTLLQGAEASGNHSLIQAVVDVIGRWKVAGLESALSELASQSTNADLASAAVGALSAYESDSARQAVAQLAAAEVAEPIRAAAISGLARRDPTTAAQQLVNMLSAGQLAGEGQLDPLVNAVLQPQSGPDALSEALAATSLDAEPARRLLRAVYGSGRADASLIEPLARAAGMEQSAAAMSPQQRAALIASVNEQGDANRGQQVFRRAELNCIKCHALTGAGGNIGPDLSGVGANSPVDYLLDTILYPSQQIKEQYLTRNVLTVDGQVVRGIVVSRDPERLILRDADGREIRLAVEDIEEESDGPSLMPEGLHNLMSQQDLVDLVRFLSELGKPGPFALNQSATVQRWQVLKDPAWYQRLAEMPEGGMEGALDSIPEEAWGVGYAMVDGTMPVAELSGLPSTGPLILRGQFDVVEAGPVAIESRPNSDVRIVLAGRSVSPRAAQPIDVEAGRRSVYMLIETPWRPANVQLRFVKPDGATTQFQLVGGP